MLVRSNIPSKLFPGSPGSELESGRKVAEAITNGLPLKRWKVKNVFINANGKEQFSEGSNEYLIKRMGPSSENKGPSGKRARPYRQMLKAIAGRMPKRISA